MIQNNRTNISNNVSIKKIENFSDLFLKEYLSLINKISYKITIVFGVL